MNRILVGVCLGVLLNLVCLCGAADTRYPDEHAPIGVMGDHTHKDGEWMLSYRFMSMQMKDNRDGNSRLDESEVLLGGTGNYRIAPVEMTMTMHMLGVMYAPSDRLTLMAMIPYVENEMDHVTMMGGEFTTRSSHLGDISITALSAFDSGLIWSLGISAPTGDQDQKDLTPMGNAVLPYPMQIGSGTWDLIAGIGSNVIGDDHSWGFQAKAIVRIGENDDDYALGDQLDLSAWYAWRLDDRLSISARGIFQLRGNYDGSDPRYAGALAMNLVPTVDPDLRGGRRLDLAVGLNWVHPPSGHRFALEYQVPAWQDLDGPQLEVDETLTLGWQLAF